MAHETFRRSIVALPVWQGQSRYAVPASLAGELAVRSTQACLPPLEPVRDCRPDVLATPGAFSRTATMFSKANDVLSLVGNPHLCPPGDILDKTAKHPS